ncbi:MAG: hypothetical protein HY560_02305 [Gemmatimonadetes bacterium]|nr:hypothetical protein [Gemmatimonadota bacterium]
MRFIDRADAGKWLAARLERLRIRNPVVLAIPRGGVFVGYEIARVLDAPLDVIVASSGRRAQVYRHGQPPVSIAGKTVILVGDGLESPGTVLGAVAAAKRGNPAHLVFATPICSPPVCEVVCGTIRQDAHEVIALTHPTDKESADRRYAHLTRPTDAEVIERLDAARAERQAVLWL